jgi:hypothetical protein
LKLNEGPEGTLEESDYPEYLQRLAELDFSVELLANALDWAAADVRSCTEFDAPSQPGSMFWSRTNRYIAEQLVPQGWARTARDSILRCVHPSGSHAVTAISATGGVGNPKKRVRSKNPKGPAMARLVERNGQLTLMTHDEVLYGKELDQIPTWCLLYKRDRRSGRVVAEVSLPVKMNGKYVGTFKPRIPLDMPDLGDPGVDIALLDDPGPSGPAGAPEVKVELLGGS